MISYPRDFPFDGCFTGDCPFRLAVVQETSLGGNASPDVIGIAPSYHTGQWSTETRSRVKYGAWEAWIDSLRGGLRLFKGRPARHRWPFAHPRGFAGVLYSGSQWSGLGNLSSIGAGRDVIGVNQIPNGITLQPGDWISIPVGARQRIHKVLEGGTSAGNALSLTVEPIITPGVVTGIAVRIDTPYCDMVLDGTPELVPFITGGGRISFAGKQILI